MNQAAAKKSNDNQSSEADKKQTGLDSQQVAGGEINSLWHGMATHASGQDVQTKPKSPAAPTLVQRLCAECDQEQQGEVTNIQPKLTIGAPNDPYEQEADAVADKVMRMPAGGASPDELQDDSPQIQTKPLNRSLIQRMCAGCEDEAEEQQLPSIQRKPESARAAPAPTRAVHEAINTSSGGSPLQDSVRSRIEPVLSADLSHVRVHTDKSAQNAAQSINARAFTHRKNIFVGEGQSPGDLRLMAHENTHVVQQGAGQIEDSRLSRHPDTDWELELQINPESTFSQSNLDSEFPDVNDEVVWLDSTYDSLVEALVFGVLTESGAIRQRDYNSHTERHRRTIVGRTRDAMISQDRFDAASISIWLEQLVMAAEQLPVLIERLPESEDRQVWRDEVDSILTVARALANHRFITDGVALRGRHQEENAHRSRINDAIDYTTRFTNRHYREDLSNIEYGLWAGALANELVYNRELSADDIREVLDGLALIDPELQQRALFQGETAYHLLRRGLSGFQAYQAEQEGFFSGLIRGEMESLAADPASTREFNIGEKLIAVGGFLAGVIQGVFIALWNNIKSLIDLLTPAFWSSLYDFFTEFLPSFIDSPAYRFQLGQSMGLASANEIRRLADASPFEYGRTLGSVFGQALVEIALMFIGLGFLLKAVRASRTLSRAADWLGDLAHLISRTALARRSISVVQGIGEAINALSRRVNVIRRRIPAMSANERVRRAIEDLNDAERAGHELFERAARQEEAARRALAGGDNAAAQQHIDELTDTVADIERHFPEDTSRATTRAATGEMDDALTRSANLEGNQILDDLPALDAEVQLVGNMRRRPSSRPGYIDEVELPNGHVWRRNDHGWCRFSDTPFCLIGDETPGSTPRTGGDAPPQSLATLTGREQARARHWPDDSQLPTDASGNPAYRWVSGPDGVPALHRRPGYDGPRRLFDPNAPADAPLETRFPELPSTRRRTLRQEYLGATPGKRSRTGREVIERMRNGPPPPGGPPPRGRIVGTEPDERVFTLGPQGEGWYHIDDMDMGHLHDAVVYWNTDGPWGRAGRSFGPRSQEVRDWMLDPVNYALEHFSINRSRGSILGQTQRYLDPL